MKLEKHTMFGKCSTVSYPVFTWERDDDSARLMNRFYEKLAAEALAWGDENGAKCRGRYTAEFTAKLSDSDKTPPDKAGASITYVIRMRRRGRTLSKRTFTHVWSRDTVVDENDSFSPPNKNKFRFFR
jgi:hypothetical protein